MIRRVPVDSLVSAGTWMSKVGVRDDWDEGR